MLQLLAVHVDHSWSKRQERAKDLLGDPKKKESLDVRTHPVYGVYVPNLTEFPLTSAQPALQPDVKY